MLKEYNAAAIGKEMKALPRVWDLTAYIVYDHRYEVSLEDLAAKVIKTVLDDTVFMQMC